MAGVGVVGVCFPGVVLFLEIEVEGGVVVVVVGGAEVPWCSV